MNPATDTPTSCPACGSADVVDVLRDGPADRPRAFGHWRVCQRCGREWRAESRDDTEETQSR